VKRLALVISCTTFTLPIAIIQAAVSLNTGQQEVLTAAAAASLSSLTTIVTFVVGVAKLVLLVIISVKRDKSERHRFQHTICCCGRAWWRNRQPAAEHPASATSNTSLGGSYPVSAAPGLASSSSIDPLAHARDALADSSRSCASAEMSESGWAGRWVSHEGDDDDDDDNDDAELGEATCFACALFALGQQRGFFMQLPTSETQPIPFLFVPIVKEMVLPPRGQMGPKKKAIIRVAYRCRDVGELDGDVVEQVISNRPQAAWEALQMLAPEARARPRNANG
jgi:hypothetical protein